MDREDYGPTHPRYGWTKNNQSIPVITCAIRFRVVLLATAVVLLGMLSPSHTLGQTTGCSADVVFLMDNTGSMWGMINSTRTNATEILNKISGGDERFEGIDVQYGVATYWGDPREHVGGGGSTASYHCSDGSAGVAPAPTQFSGSSNTIAALDGGDYYVDLIDTWGDGWHGNRLTIKNAATNATVAVLGAGFSSGRYMSGGTVNLVAGNSYTVTYSTAHWWHYEIRWRICPVGSGETEDEEEPTGYPDIAREAFKVNQAMTAEKSEITTAMAEWSASGGGDLPEANFFALHQLATEGGMTDGNCEPGFTGTCTDLGYKTDYSIGWREDAGKIIVWFGDARSHCTTVSANEALAALKTKNIVVAAINTRSGSSGIDQKYSCDGSTATVGQASHITIETKGTLTNNVSGSTGTVNAILDAVSKGIAQVGSAAAVSFSSGKLETSTHLYQSFFDASDWSGDLRAFQLDPETGSVASSVWKAAELLDAKNPDNRVILTMGWDDDTSGEVPAPFRWDSLSSAQKKDLRTEHGGTKEEAESKGQARLAYLRGDRTNEGTAGYQFRLRGSVLGDIWHSSPIYYGKPNQQWPDTPAFGDGDKYSDFQASQATRHGVVYVGSNGGMLHAFHADTGEEILAYVPGNLYSDTVGNGYHQLSDPNFEHTSLYVDGTPRVTDAHIKTRAYPVESWRSVLIGTQGAGGSGLFALDVTDPSAFDESSANEIVLWEFSDSDDPHLGKTYSRPDVALLNNGKWAVIIGNGPEDTATDSDAGEAQLFIITLEGGLDGTWTEGTDYWRITTNLGEESNRNGLFSPATVDLDGNGTADRVYAGDLHGRMWAFDLSSSNPSHWGLSAGGGSSTKPLFHAFVSGATGTVDQPITTEPTIAYHPTIEDGPAPNLMVFFGTGKFLDEADKTDLNQQSYYGIWDTGHRSSGGDLTRANLAAQSFIVNDSTTGERVLQPISEMSPDYEGTEGSRQFGWYIDLDAGERVASRSLFRLGILHFNTIIPDSSVCASGGTGWEMAVESENGGSPKEASFDFNQDGVVTITGDTYTITAGSPPTASTVGYAGQKMDADKGMPAGPAIIGNRLYTSSTGTDASSTDFVGSDKLLAGDDPSASLDGRRSWQELSKSY